MRESMSTLEVARRAPSERRVLAKVLALCAVFLVAFGCGVATKVAAPPADASARELGAALEAYRSAILKGDAELASQSFAEDAELSHESQPPLHGRKAIRDLLASFSGYRVESYELAPSSTVTVEGGFLQRGEYRQSVLTPQGQAIRVAGTFEATWSRGATGSWLIKKMHTVSAGKNDG